jgi:hypothetical protein
MKAVNNFIISLALLLPTQSWGETHVQFGDLPEFQAAASTFVLTVVCIETVPDELDRFKELAVEARNEMLRQARVANVFSAEELIELSHTTLKSLSNARFSRRFSSWARARHQRQPAVDLL